MKKAVALKCTFFFLLFTITFAGCSTQKKNDENLVNTELDDLLHSYRDSIYQAPIAVRSELFTLRQNTPDSIDYYKITNLAAYTYFLSGQIDSAFIITEQIVDYCERVRPVMDPVHLAELETYVYNSKGLFYQTVEKFDSALIYLEKSVNSLMRAGLKNKLPDTYINLADNYNFKGDFTSAITYYRKALSIGDSINKTEHFGSVYYGMARIYTDLRNFKAADQYYSLAEEEVKNNPLYEQFLFTTNRAYNYYQEKKYEKSIDWFRKSRDQASELENPYYTAMSNANLGEVFIAVEEADSARYYLDKAGKYFLQPGVHESLSFYFNGLRASLALSENDLIKAEQLLSIQYDEKTLIPNYVYMNNKRLEALYAKKGDFKKAYQYSQKVIAYDDSLHNITVQNNIAEIDSRYRQDTTLLRRDILLNESKTENLKLRNLTILLIFLLVIVVLFITIVGILLRRRREQRYQRQVSTITQLRMESIRNRISPHYIFNILNVIMPVVRQYDELSHTLKLLIDSIRYNLTVSEKMAIPLEEEIRIVRNYIELRESTKFTLPCITWDISLSENELQILIPSMCIQIPVENAIKYAYDYEDKDRDNHLLIKIWKENHFIHILIEDNGTGYDSKRYADKKQGTGTGLKVLFNTVELLNIRNAGKMEISIRNRKDNSPDLQGTCVRIIIPMDYNFKL